MAQLNQIQAGIGFEPELRGSWGFNIGIDMPMKIGILPFTELQIVIRWANPFAVISLITKMRAHLLG